MHLQRIEAAGLVSGSLELSEDGKAMKHFEVTPFAYALTPHAVAEAARTITDQRQQEEEEQHAPSGAARPEKENTKRTAKPGRLAPPVPFHSPVGAAHVLDRGRPRGALFNA